MEWALPIIDEQKCIACGDCIAVCPTNVLGLRHGKLVYCNPHNCTFCTLCEQICPHKAVRCEFVITGNEWKG